MLEKKEETFATDLVRINAHVDELKAQLDHKKDKYRLLKEEKRQWNLIEGQDKIKS